MDLERLGGLGCKGELKIGYICCYCLLIRGCYELILINDHLIQKFSQTVFSLHYLYIKHGQRCLYTSVLPQDGQNDPLVEDEA